MESPDYVRTSLAAGITLNLVPGRFYRDAKLYCINLLVTYRDGCTANCSYCGLSRIRPGEYQDKSFIRVDWPVFPTDLIAERIAQLEEKKEIKRVCISMVTRRRSVEDTVKIARKIRMFSDVPISMLISPTVTLERDFLTFKEAGADKIGIAIDAATDTLFDYHRGRGVNGPHNWERYWKTFEIALEYFGKGNVGSHFIVGIGETEKEMVYAIQKIRDMGGETHLFSFFPEPLSKLQEHPRPHISTYRRLQLARFLIDNGISRADIMRFDEKDRIIDFGVEIGPYIASGKPFMTSGCTGRDGEVACNRPYANEKPSEEPRNFPFPPSPEEIESIKKELKVYID
ncbi:radical SAM protein [bacterium]|nr:MAG: radical SAM protein [bacterium]RKZ24182.1 MAG: radical SAM protein [bacterium]